MLGITALSQSPIASLGGTSVNVAVTGIQLTSSVNGVTTQANADAFPTSQLLTTTVDSVVADVNTPVDLLGEQLTINLGDETIKVDVAAELTGEGLTFTIGTYSISANGNTSIISGPEQELQTTVDSVITTADANAFPTGIQLSSNLGNADIDLNTPVDVTGQQLTTALGSVTAVPSVEVNVTGQQLTVSIREPSIIAWSNVDPDVTNIWTEVNLGVTNNWAEVDIAA